MSLQESRLPAPQDTASPDAGVGFWLIPVVIFFLALLAYANTLGFAFVFDDQVVVVDNRYVQSWNSLPALFTEHIWSELHSTVQRNYYRPVFLFFLLLNHSFFGLDPIGWHAATVLLHAAASVLLFFVARRLCGAEAPALTAAVLFALHPIHIEAVAWVSGSAEPLAASLLLGSFLCYLRWSNSPRTAGPATQGPSRPRWVWLSASLLFYVLAAFSKEGALLLPLLIGAHALLFPDPRGQADAAASGSRNRRFVRALTIVTAFLPVAALYLAARVAVLGAWGYAANPKMTTGTLLLTLPGVIAGYLRRLIWPFGLSPFYDVPEVAAISWGGVILPALVLLVAAGATAWLARRSRAAAFGAAWFAVTLLPVLNLRVFPAGEFLHDRYLYLPSAGFCLLAGVAVWELLLLRTAPMNLRARLGLATIAALLLAVAVWSQSHIWRSNRELYEHGMRAAPGNFTAANNYALELLKAGRTDEARTILAQVVSRNPGYWLAHYNLGEIAYRAGDMPAAEQHLRRAIAVSSADAEQFALLGRVLFRAGKTEEAIEAMKQALGRRPRQPGYHFALGVMLAAQGMDREALSEFRRELELNPQHPAARQQAMEAEQRILRRTSPPKKGN